MELDTPWRRLVALMGSWRGAQCQLSMLMYGDQAHLGWEQDSFAFSQHSLTIEHDGMWRSARLDPNRIQWLLSKQYDHWPFYESYSHLHIHTCTCTCTCTQYMYTGMLWQSISSHFLLISCFQQPSRIWCLLRLVSHNPSHLARSVTLNLPLTVVLPSTWWEWVGFTYVHSMGAPGEGKHM